MHVHPIAPFARVAFAHGVAISGGPITERVKAGCVAAVQLAIEHADDPDVLEATLQLGALEGTWALIYQRREKLHADNEQRVVTAWQALGLRKLAPVIVAAARRKAGLTEAAGQDEWLTDLIRNNVTANVGDWTGLLDSLHASILNAQAEGNVAAQALSAGDLAAVGLSFDIAFEDAYKALERNADMAAGTAETDAWLAQLLGSNASDIAAKLGAMTRAGASYEDMTAEVGDILEGASGRSIATAVDVLTSRALSRGALDLYRADGLNYVDFLTAGDQRVCFPAGTPVSTPAGFVAIDTLRVGDLVDTPVGPHAVTATMARPYLGRVIGVRAAGRVVAATEDHPFWTPDGWKSAGSLRIGDQLQTIANELVKVDGIVEFELREPDDPEPHRSEEGVSSGIPRSRAGVPVDAVYFQRDAEIEQDEVDGPPANLALLLESDAEPFERLTDARLQFVLAPASPVAGDVAEGSPSAGRLGRNDAANLPTLPACEVDGRTSTGLGAVVPVEALLGAEPLAATLAVDVLRVAGLAGGRADVVPVRGRAFGDGEGLLADRAGLGHGIGPGGVVARSRAELALAVAAGLGVEGNATPTTGSVGNNLILGTAVAAHRAEGPGLDGLGVAHERFAALIARELERQNTSPVRVLVGRIQVYDIEVEDQHVFYAAGLLVHNCPICSALEKRNPYLLADAPLSGQHPYCRCALSPADHPANNLLAQAAQVTQPAAATGTTRALSGRIKSGVASAQALGGGYSAATDLVRLKDGSQAVRKVAHAYGEVPAAVATDAEYLASLLGRSLGVPMPEVLRTASDTVFMEYVADAETAAERYGYQAFSTNPERLAFAASDDGRRIGLFDLAVSNSDRNDANWMIGADGGITAIDHGFAFGGYATLQEAIDTLSVRNIFVRQVIEDGFSVQDVQAVRQALQKLEPKFKRLRRQLWYRDTMEQLDDMERIASGERRLFA